MTVAAGCLWLGGLAAGQGPAQWERIEAPAREFFRRVQADAAGNVWVLGDRVHQRRADGSWAAPVSIPGEGWGDMAVVRDDLMFGVSPLGESIEVMRAGTWSRLAALPSCISQRATIVMLGRTVAMGCPYYSGLVMWRVDELSGLQPMGSLAPWDIALIGEDDVVAVGLQGVVRVRRGDSEPVSLDRDTGLRLIWASLTHIVTLDGAGMLHHASWDSRTNRVGTWTTHRVPGAARLNRLWGSRADNLFAVGQGGVILHFDGTSWTTMASGVTVNLQSISGGGRYVWAAGDDGTILRLESR